MFFELVSFLFAIVPNYGNKYMTKENKKWTSFKNFEPELNLNHNIYYLLEDVQQLLYFCSSTCLQLLLVLTNSFWFTFSQPSRIILFGC